MALMSYRLLPACPRALAPVGLRSLEMVEAAHEAGRLKFFANHHPLLDAAAFDPHLKPLRGYDWDVYAKPPLCAQG